MSENKYYNIFSAFTESINSLATNIEFADLDARIKSILVTSANANDGKTTISVNLGRVWAKRGYKTIVVDSDFRNPNVSKAIGFENSIGIMNVLSGGMSLDRALIKDKETGLDLLLSGPLPPNPTQVVSSTRYKDLVKELENQYDYVVIDTAPVGIITDAAIISTFVDGSVIVVSPRDTKMPDLQSAAGNIKHVGGRLLGIVINKAEVGKRKSRYYYYTN